MDENMLRRRSRSRTSSRRSKSSKRSTSRTAEAARAAIRARAGRTHRCSRASCSARWPDIAQRIAPTSDGGHSSARGHPQLVRAGSAGSRKVVKKEGAQTGSHPGPKINMSAWLLCMR